ncbi:MAG: glycoside hydrolase family 27 protein [Terracidiphilus sp.]
MDRRKLFFAALIFVFAATFSTAQSSAPTPPMGWNSWDAYGWTIGEAEFKANAAVLASIKQFGWQYAVIDQGWYMENPLGTKLAERQYLLDGNGIEIPVASRFPDSAEGAGFKPLADWVHAQGLKFGLHIIRGIPRQAVERNLPIAGSAFHAAEAADIADACPWDDGNWGMKDNEAGQAYYDAMLKLYAGWGLDYLKVDCVSDHPYRPTEIRQIAEAIRKTGRPIVLSLSPGPTQLEHAAEVAKYAQMWRISDDHWDGWKFPHKAGDGEWPFGVGDEFDRIAAWAPYVKPGNWPDPDMLPEGSLTPHPGWGEARQSRLTPDEQQTEFTLWAFSRSPLIFCGNLTKLDDFTRSLMTNKRLLQINQQATWSRPVTKLPAGFENVRVWEASLTAGAKAPDFLAFFNLDDKPVTLHSNWKQLGLENGKYWAQNLWSKDSFKETKDVTVTLPAHGSTVYALR